MNRILKYFLFIVLGLVLLLIFMRAFSPTQVDDVNPMMPCSDEMLDKVDVFYVIPKYQGISISDNKTWCDKILSMNKTLRMHGVYHTYEEFSKERDYDYLMEGIDIFEECFGFLPNEFKPPQLKISENNKGLIKSVMKLDGYWNQVLHKVYHCNDTEVISNKVISII